MLLSSLSLQNFRNYSQAAFTFSPHSTILVGQNTVGKTNLLDSIHLLSTGKSFLTDKEEELIRFGEEFGRIKGKISDLQDDNSLTILEILLTADTGQQKAGKRFFVNDVARRRTDFAIHLPTLLFTPMHLSIISGNPNQRRSFLDEVLEQVDREYARSIHVYMKALRQRNALLEHARETGYRNDQQFQYWDELLITTGTYIHDQRQLFIDFINAQPQHIFPSHVIYDHSIISEERLEKYKDAEMGACVTLVGPHRDDVKIEWTIENGQLKITETKEIKTFASRGQQRLAVLQLKVLQLQYMQDILDTTPLLLLDDIFSELDSSHIQLVSDMIGKQQTIITTTHEEFIQGKFKEKAKVIELGK